MKILSTRVALLAAVASAAAIPATPAFAQATRTWVSGVGDDVNPCSRTAPCKTFAGAISKTAPGGEINCLDPAGFGAVTITKSITIDCTGTLGGILASSTTGVIVNGAGVKVVLRGLAINGGPPNLPGVNGVRYLQGASVLIQDSYIHNFLGASPNGFGVIVNATSGDFRLAIVNTVIANNGTGNTGGGIAIIPTGTASGRVSLDHVTVTGNAGSAFIANISGSSAALGVSVAIDDSQFSNSPTGMTLTATGPGNLAVLVNNSRIVNNTTGIAANGAVSVSRFANSTITANNTGISIAGAAIVASYGNNRLDGNPTTGAPNDGSFSPGIIPPH